MTDIQRADLGELEPARLEALEEAGWRFTGARHPRVEHLGGEVHETHGGLFSAEWLRHGHSPVREAGVTVRALIDACQWQTDRLQDLAPKRSANVAKGITTSRDLASVLRSSR